MQKKWPKEKRRGRRSEWLSQQIADGDGEVTRRPMLRVAQKKSSNAQYRADKGAPNIKAAPGQDGLRPIIMAGGSLYVWSQLLWAEWGGIYGQGRP